MSDSVATVAALILSVVIAAAPGAVTADEGPAAVDVGDHLELMHVAQDLEQIRHESPEAFETVEYARRAVIAWGERSGQRPPNVPRMLTGEDDDALLLAMLWRLTDDDPLASGMELRAWRRWRIGLIEAIGRMRDERSLPVLYSVVAGPQPSGRVRTAATSALGRVGDRDYIERVVELADDDEDRRSAIVRGLGDARRLVALEYLLEIAVRTDDEDRRAAAIRAAGDWANQWAWQTSSLAPHRDEGREGRRRVVEVLVDEYPGFGPSSRREAVKSLQLAGGADGRDRALKRAGEAEGQHRRLFEQLAGRLADSPLR